MPIYKDDRNVITPLFDQIRRITETEDAMTFERATESLLNVTPGAELPSAEESSFGVDTAGEEYGIVTLGTLGASSVSTRQYSFNKYTANEAFSIIGLRVYAKSASTKRLCLYNANGERVRTTAEITTTANTWTMAYLDEPVNIAIGESFIVSDVATGSGVQYLRRCDTSDATFNGKVTYNGGQASSGALPSNFDTKYIYGVVDFIIGTGSAELPDEYQIARTTMDDIAEEVQRITGTESKMTTAQIVTGLQSVTDGSGLPPNAKLYYVGNANSEFDLCPLFESSAVGELQEE